MDRSKEIKVSIDNACNAIKDLLFLIEFYMPCAPMLINLGNVHGELKYLRDFVQAIMEHQQHI